MDIRKFIKEEIDKILDKQELEKKFTQDIVYLKNFSLNKKKDNGSNFIWILEHKQKDYTLRFYIQNNKEDDSWISKIFIYWKKPSKIFTNTKGKDFECTFGPFSFYEEMVAELNRKLTNNPLISMEIYVDDENIQFNKNILEMLKILLKNNELTSVRDIYFDDLKKIYNEVKLIKSIEELQKYIDKKYPDINDKQNILFVLHKVYRINFYLKKEQLEDLF